VFRPEGDTSENAPPYRNRLGGFQLELPWSDRLANENDRRGGSAISFDPPSPPSGDRPLTPQSRYRQTQDKGLQRVESRRLVVSAERRQPTTCGHCCLYACL